ncbi:MAG: hypothetical protein LBC97_07195 [Bifidobacteriaceae bacterium]|jgi:hypothetical protein|nr:hypothetical protein [Bifidobacteriaceae bacterium]
MTPQLSIVRGAATPEELAALTASLAVLAGQFQASQVPDAVHPPARITPGGVVAGRASAPRAGGGASAWKRQAAGWQTPSRFGTWPFA